MSSKYRTLFGHEIRVITLLDKRETHVFTKPNSVIEYVPLVDFVSWGKPPEGEAMKGQPGNGSSKVHIHAGRRWEAGCGLPRRSCRALPDELAAVPVAHPGGMVQE